MGFLLWPLVARPWHRWLCIGLVGWHGGRLGLGIRGGDEPLRSTALGAGFAHGWVAESRVLILRSTRYTGGCLELGAEGNGLQGGGGTEGDGAG
jgi:hypothetical protein